MRSAKALASLRICADSHEHSLLADAISTRISRAVALISHVTMATVHRHFFFAKVCTALSNRGDFNNARARRALIDCYLVLFVMYKACHQYNERLKALALLNLSQFTTVA